MNQSAPNLRILDCTVGQDPMVIHSMKHIKGSQWFDLTICRDLISPYPHMIPKQEYFVPLMRALNVRKSHDVVLYEQGYGWYAERTAFVFRSFGHKNVRVLDGHLRKWMDEGKPTESDAQPAKESDFEYSYNGDQNMSFEEIVKAKNDGSVQIVDIRAE